MKIIPQNGHMLVEMMGRGDYTTNSGLILPVNSREKPNIDEVVKFKVLAIDPNPIEDDKQFPYMVGQVVCAQGLNSKPITKRNQEDEGEKQRFYFHHTNIISVIEEDDASVN